MRSENTGITKFSLFEDKVRLRLVSTSQEWSFTELRMSVLMKENGQSWLLYTGLRDALVKVATSPWLISFSNYDNYVISLVLEHPIR